MSEFDPQNLMAIFQEFSSKISLTNLSEIHEVNDVQNLEVLLKKNFGDKLIVVDKTLENLVEFGTGFSSKLLKIDIKLQRTKDSPTEDVYMVAKTPIFAFPTDWTSIFKKEIFFYTDIIPLYKRIEVNCGISETKVIANLMPKFYGSRMSLKSEVDTADQDAAILLENLKVSGYHLMDKKDGLDLEHTSLALKTLARFHAIGIAGRRRFSSDFETIKNSEWIKYTVDHKMIILLYMLFVESIKQDPRYNKNIETITKILERESEGWKHELFRHDLWTTIIHNDFWTNNIMFHNDEAGKVDKIKIIDYQLYAFADIFVDLSYFLFSSLNDDVKMNHFDEVLDIYYNTFISHLRELGVDVEEYTKAKFDKRFKEIAGSNFLRIAVAHKLFTADTDGVDQQKFFMELMTGKGNDLYHKKLEQLFKIYEQKDWLH